jgi:hypothetical protein
MQKEIGNFGLKDIRELSDGRTSATLFEKRRDEHGRESWICVTVIIRKKGETWESAIDRVNSQ